MVQNGNNRASPRAPSRAVARTADQTAARVDLNGLRSFVAVHAAGGFSGAAAALGVPRSTVSRAVAALEDELGVRLFHRTTRKVAATTAGIALYDRIAPSLTALTGALRDLPEREEVPSGVLRVTATPDIGAAVLAEAAARFTARHPGTQVEAHLTARVIDLVREGFDLALRVSRGPLRDAALVSRKVGAITLRLYASPAYLARRGTPRTPAELVSHDWATFHSVPYLEIPGASLPPPRVTCDDMGFMREVLRQGGGIGALPTFLADADVAAGALVRVIPRWVIFTGTVHLVQPGRTQVPRKVTAFREVLGELLRHGPLAAAPADTDAEA